MRKVIPILIFALIIPQIASAAWWNPFSWNIFKKQGVKTEVLENRIRELESKLEKVAPSNSESINSSSEENKPVSTKDNRASDPLIKSNATVPSTVIQTVESKKTLSLADIMKKYSDFRSVIIAEKSSINKNSQLETEKDYYKYLDELVIKIGADLGYLNQIENINPKPAGVTDIYMSKYTKLYDEHKIKSGSYESNLDRDKLRTAKDNVIDFIRDNKYVLYYPSVHIQAAEFLYLYDNLFKTKYGIEFESRKTQQETVEFANRFLIDQD